MKKMIILVMALMLLIVSVSAQTRTKFEDMTEEDFLRGWPSFDGFFSLQYAAGLFDSQSFIYEDFESPLVLIRGCFTKIDGPFENSYGTTYWDASMMTFEGGFPDWTATGEVGIFFAEERPQVAATGIEKVVVWGLWFANFTDDSGKVIPLFRGIAYVYRGRYYSWEKYYK